VADVELSEIASATAKPHRHCTQRRAGDVRDTYNGKLQGELLSATIGTRRRCSTATAQVSLRACDLANVSGQALAVRRSLERAPTMNGAAPQMNCGIRRHRGDVELDRAREKIGTNTLLARASRRTLHPRGREARATFRGSVYRERSGRRDGYTSGYYER